MTQNQDYFVIVNGNGQLLCEKCGTTLPLEPESFRRTLTISGTTEPGWYVWRCPHTECHMVNIRKVDDVADIDTICC